MVDVVEEEKFKFVVTMTSDKGRTGRTHITARSEEEALRIAKKVHTGWTIHEVFPEKEYRKLWLKM